MIGVTIQKLHKENILTNDIPMEINFLKNDILNGQFYENELLYRVSDFSPYFFCPGNGQFPKVPGHYPGSPDKSKREQNLDCSQL